MSPNSSCGEIDLEFTHKFLPPVFMIVFVVGLVSNLWGLWNMCSTWRNIGNLNIFMLNLGVADLLYIFTLPFLVYYYNNKSIWLFGDTFCKLTRFCFNLNLYGGIGFLTCISVYRYLGIVHPLKVMGRLQTRQSVTISAVVWVLVFIQILPDMFFEKRDNNNQSACFDTTSTNSTRSYLAYSISWTVSGFVLPLLIILLCYGHILVVLSRKTTVSPVLKKRCLRLVLLLLFLFSVCFIPYHTFRIANLHTRIAKQDGTCYSSFGNIYLAHQVGRGLVCLNSAINPLIYVVGNDDFGGRVQVFRQRARRSLVRFTGMMVYHSPVEAHVGSPTETRLL